MADSPLNLTVSALLVALSCSFRAPVAQLPAVSAPPPHELADPSLAVEAVEATLLEHQTALARFEISQLAEAIVAESERNSLDWKLVMSVIQTESGFHNFARSRAGALGLMQVMPATGQGLARELGLDWSGPETLFDPILNVTIGTRYLSWLFARYGSWSRALAAYNWGPAAIDYRLRRGRRLPARYARAVMARLEPAETP